MAGFQLYTTIFVIGMILVYGFGLFLISTMIMGLLTILKIGLNNWFSFNTVFEVLYYFCVYGIPIWLLIENFLKLTGNLTLEILYQSFLFHRNLSTIYFAFMAVSCVIIFIILFISFLLSFISVTKKSKRLAALTKGINQRWKLYLVFYFLHFFVLRLTLVILIGVSIIIDSFYLWIILSCIQFMFLLLHICWIYESYDNRFFALWRELTIFTVFVWIAIS